MRPYSVHMCNTFYCNSSVGVVVAVSPLLILALLFFLCYATAEHGIRTTHICRYIYILNKPQHAEWPNGNKFIFNLQINNFIADAHCSSAASMHIRKWSRSLKSKDGERERAKQEKITKEWKVHIPSLTKCIQCAHHTYTNAKHFMNAFKCIACIGLLLQFGEDSYKIWNENETA